MKNLNKRLFFLVILGCLTSCGEKDVDSTPSEDKYCEELSKKLPHETLRLFDSQSIQETRKKIRRMVSSDIDIIQDASSYSKDKMGIEIFSFDFEHDNVSLCLNNAIAYLVNNKINLSGQIPTSDFILEDKSFDWFEKNLVLNQLQKKFPSLSDLQILQQKKCFVPSKGKFLSGFDLLVEIEKNPYRLVQTRNKIILFEPLFFDVDIKTKVYGRTEGENPEMIFKEFTLPEVSEGGSLCSERFKIEKSELGLAPFENSHVFDYSSEPNSALFYQTSMFTHANMQANWLMSLEHFVQWYGPQIIIRLNESNEGNNNIARYLPGKIDKKAIIEMGNGNGKSLQRLRLDGEAISHEVGHHVIFKNITSTSGESAVLHEGLADALVFLRTKNAYLGEFICPEKNVCVSDKYLRTAINDIKFGSDNMPRQTHLKSQLISGFIWDINLSQQKKDSNPDAVYNEVANLVYKAVLTLPKSAQYRDFIQSFIAMDKALYQSKYCLSIKDALDKRGFTNENIGINHICS